MVKKNAPILTPKTALTPRINGAKVFGIRPNSPLLFKIAATGEKPLTYSAKPLPNGVSLDSDSGILSGKISQPGTYKIQIEVSNTKGKAQREFRIECGDKICLTPTMGWNSWYVYSLWVSQEKIEAMAKAMVDSGLAEHGWTYINIDDSWQGKRDPQAKALMSNDKFPDMKKMCDYIHNLGLKIGIYSTPWVGSYAGYVGGSTPNEDYDYSALEVDMKYRYEKNQIAGQPHNMRSRHRNFGLKGCEDVDTKQWAEWGVDYLKYDWKPNDVPHVVSMLEALEKSGRDIVYSLSHSAAFALASEWVKYANLWRTKGDIVDSWCSISKIGFNQDKWAPYAGPGHWNDPDMLQVGQIATPHVETPQSRSSRLSADEQYTQVSLWCLLSAPLLLSCNLLKLDAFTLGLLTNDEVLEVDQDSSGEQARIIVKFKGWYWGNSYQILAKNLEDGSKAVGLFNVGRIKTKITITWKQLGMEGKYLVRDLWRQQYLGEFTDQFSAMVNPHGVILVKLQKK